MQLIVKFGPAMLAHVSSALSVSRIVWTSFLHISGDEEVRHLRISTTLSSFHCAKAGRPRGSERGEVGVFGFSTLLHATINRCILLE
jgi:hypothetical protein